MELNKSLILTIFISSFLFSSIDATFLMDPKLNFIMDSRIKFSFFLKAKPMSAHPPASPSPAASASPVFGSEIPFLMPEPKPIGIASPLKGTAASPSPSEPPTTTTEYPTLAFPKLPPNTKINPQLRYVCRATENPKNCAVLISPYLKGSVNVASTLKIIIHTLRVHIKEASKIAAQLRDDESTPHEMMGALDTCVELYELALGSLSRAANAYENLDVHRFKVLLGAVISNLGYCNEAFEKKGITSWPLKKHNEILIELAGYGVDIATKFSKYISGDAPKKVIN